MTRRPVNERWRQKRGLKLWSALITVSATTVACIVVAPVSASAAANPNPARITAASWWLMEELLELEPGTQNGGTYVNKPGYHNTRAANDSDNYSVRDAEDKGGPSDKTAAYDWTFPEAQSLSLAALSVDPNADQKLPADVTAAVSNYTNIARYSSRLLASGQDPNDPRLNGWREFFGQADSDTSVEGYDFRYNQTATSDSSHLWHIHLSEDRDQVESFENKQALLSVLRGETVEQWEAGFGNAVSDSQSTDLDGDGDAELVRFNSDGTVSAFRNNGILAGNAWSAAVVIATNPGTTDPLRMRFADLDNDGLAEFVRINSDGTVSAFRNNGILAGNAWSAAVVIATSPGTTDPLRMRFADLNNDGLAEFVRINSDGTVSAFRNNGILAGNAWSAAVVIAASPGTTDPLRMRFADLNNDGLAEFVRINSDGTVSAFRNNGILAGNAWSAAVVIAASPGTTDPLRMRFADLNNDGLAEFVRINSDGTVSAFRNNGILAGNAWSTDVVVAANPGTSDPARLAIA
ncbi:Repeat domain-containing protein [Micromonospora zamorensis]|nr:Repeat domain-containing protein [Micromonospora zamorensis]